MWRLEDCSAAPFFIVAFLQGQSSVFAIEKYSSYEMNRNYLDRRLTSDFFSFPTSFLWFQLAPNVNSSEK